MAENTDTKEELPEDQNESLPENSSIESISESETSQITEPQSKTKNMETHAHDLHKVPGHGWKHYIFEFLMLFLAVFCGFLAENFREDQVEHQREKQYMQSFIYDLQNDTTNLNEGFPRKDQRLTAIDSVLLFFESNPDAKIIPGFLLRHMRRTLWDRHYRRNSATIDQLRNAGGLRLIRKKNVRDSIAAYDLQWQRAEFWREGYVILQEKGKDMMHKILNANDLLVKYRKDAGFSNNRKITDTMKNVRINPEYLNEFLNFISDQKITTTQDKNGYEAIEQSAERLIALIKKEYDLE